MTSPKLVAPAINPYHPTQARPIAKSQTNCSSSLTKASYPQENVCRENSHLFAKQKQNHFPLTINLKKIASTPTPLAKKHSEPFGLLQWGLGAFFGTIGISGCAPQQPGVKTPANKIPVEQTPTRPVPKDPVKETLADLKYQPDGDFFIKLEATGDPKKGRVFWIKSPAPNNMTLQNNRFVFENSRYQLEVLKLLEGLAQRPKTIFIQDPLIALSPEAAAQIEQSAGHFIFNSTNPLGLSPKKIRQVFPNPLPQWINLNAARLRNSPEFIRVVILGNAGAPLVYQSRNQGSRLYPTTTAMFQKEFHNKVGRLLFGKTLPVIPQETALDMVHWVANRREEIATKKMVAFLKKHPGETLVIILEPHHHIVDNFTTEGFTPQVISFDWHLADTPIIDELRKSMDPFSGNSFTMAQLASYEKLYEIKQSKLQPR